MLAEGDFYQEFLTALNKHNVQYMIIGGFAVNMYGFARVTEDMDIWINPAPENLLYLKNAIISLGFTEENHLTNFLAQESIMLRIADDSFRVDLLTKLNIKKNFAQAYTTCQTVDLSYGRIFFLSYDDLIDEKIRAQRPKDLIDIEQLRKIRGS